MRNFLSISILFTSLFLTSCGNIQFAQDDTINKNSSLREYTIQSVMWQQNAAEWRALCYQAFNIATYRLNDYLADSLLNGKRLAIITDVDETMLDNSPYNAQLIIEDKDYTPETWYEWTERAEAIPIPGAVEFLNYVKSKGIEVFYVTNRDSIEKEATIKNMISVGFPYADQEHVLPKTNLSSKNERFAIVQATHEVLLFMGDNCSDFSNEFRATSTNERNNLVEKYKDEFGKRFIVFPNPMYGDWESRGIYQGKHDIPNSKKEEIRIESLRIYK
ncbi:MAG: 5'-nucleotidase, lipoprotein e(P4) family [Brumimicrobium sp.]